MSLVLAFDVGTAGVKAGLYRIGDRLELIAADLQGYDLRILPDGGAEQDPEDWWDAMRGATAAVLQAGAVSAADLQAISFSCQMQGLVLVDERGRPVRPAMSYMDRRATHQCRRGLNHGLRFAGLNLAKVLPSLRINGGISASVKDPLWKYHWVRENEPDRFARVRYWLDVKDYLVARCVGSFSTTPDCAQVTFLYDSRPDRERWSRTLTRMFEVDPDHLPPVIRSTDIAGGLSGDAARDLGLTPGTPVVGGGGDLTTTALGAGGVTPGDAHVYIGTSGWIGVVTDQRRVDISTRMAAIAGAEPGIWNYIGLQETSGKCLEWAVDHLAKDGIGLYPRKQDITEGPAPGFSNLWDFVNQVVAAAEPACGGVLFTPWLHGNRSPFEDNHARGIFFNLGLETGKPEMLRAVVEGMVFQKRWMLEEVCRRIPVASELRFVGGGALSDTTAQILADVTGRSILAIQDPQHVGAAGAALLAGIALGKIGGFRQVPERVHIRRTFSPHRERADIYERNYRVFKKLYASNRAHFAALNG